MSYEQNCYGVIYLITSPSKKMYVGQTTNLKVRYGLYKNCECKKQIKLYAAIKKYGWNNMNFKIICECSDQEDLDAREIHLIKLFDCINTGYNCTEGGRGGKRSAETVERMRKARTGAVFTKRHKHALKKAAQALKNSERGKKKMARLQELRRIKNPEFFKTIYNFQNESGELFSGTREQFRNVFGHNSSTIFQYLFKNKKPYKGWNLIK